MASNGDKGQRYIAALNNARVNGTWTEFPELIRKITKHAPQRKLLSDTAATEYAIVSQASAANRRPVSGQSQPPPRPLPELILSLEASLKSGGSSAEDQAQGQTCLLWARWIDREPSESTIQTANQLDLDKISRSSDSLWTKICLVRTAYIKASLYSQANRRAELEATCKEIQPWLTANRTTITSAPQLQYWSQQMLAFIATTNQAKTKGDSEESLAVFRQWSSFSMNSVNESPATYGDQSASFVRPSIWKHYYKVLSATLERSTTDSRISRKAIAEEFRKVSTSYETELLRQMPFPKANQSNAEIEEWVEQIICNWQILCGPHFHETDLGDGGRNSVGRHVLDVLYRASMKSFHSTPILRRLFEVHKSLAEFDLAYQALDTYLEYIDRGRARAAKSGEPIEGQDDDELIVCTIADGIEGLCSFGRQAEAEKAHGLCLKLEKFLKEQGIDLNARKEARTTSTNGVTEYSTTLSKRTVGIVHRALGIGKAHWSRWTPFNETRSSLQISAINHIKTAVAQDLSPTQQIRSLYALTLLLAETREIDQAIQSAKKALSIRTSDSTSNGTYAHHRQLLPLWHLMALLLSARQDFDIANQSCVAAFEQFPSTSGLFGTKPSSSPNSEKAGRKESRGVIDDMECYELERMIEVELTELALTELREGPDHAVNKSNDVLGLFSRVFGSLGVAGENLITTKSKESGQGSTRHRGSIFRHRKGHDSPMTEKESSSRKASALSESTRPSTQATLAPTITVTDQDGHGSSTKGLRHSRRSQEQLHQDGKASSRSRDRIHKLMAKVEHHHDKDDNTRSDTAAVSQAQSSAPSSDATNEVVSSRPGLITIPSGAELPAANLVASHDKSPDAKVPLKTIPHNLSHDDIPPPASHDRQPPEQDVRLPVLHQETTATAPAPRFSQTASQKYALAILVKIWLVVARLYRRANMFEDAREAASEAGKAAAKIEKLISTVESSARAFADPGWGCGGKSSDEIWADVYCERAELLVDAVLLREDVDTQIDHDDIREAVDHYEQCLMYFPNHPGGIKGLSNLLLDYYERKVELAQKIDDGRVFKSTSMTSNIRRTGNWSDETTISNSTMQPRDRRPGLSSTFASSSTIGTQTVPTISTTAADKELVRNPGGAEEFQISLRPQLTLDERDELRKTPENLNRLAARDRAYGLLSTLTKLGSGWDDSAAWFALARAHELGGEREKAKDILWWCVQLEDTRPIRHWRNLGSGGYVLG